MDQFGLKYSLDRTDLSNLRLRGWIEDSRETANPPLNSASGNWNVSQATNLYDGNWHTIVFSWACDDRASLTAPLMARSGGSPGAQVLAKAICLVDGNIIGNEAAQSFAYYGKTTPLEFVYNDSSSATFLGLAAQMNGYAATSEAASTQVVQPGAFIVKRLAIWDRPLGPDGSDNLGLAYGIAQPDGPNSLFGNVSSKFGVDFGDQGNLTTGGYWDPLTGSMPGLAALSGNVVAYYKFDESPVLVANATSATDWAAFDHAAVSKGTQLSPSMGNTLDFREDAHIIQPYFTLQDVYDFNQSGLFNQGSIQFQDDNGAIQKVGYINYDLGEIILDKDYSLNGVTGLPFLTSIGASGFTWTQSASGNNFWIMRFNFNSERLIERLSLNIGASGAEMNISENPTAIDQTTGAQLLKDPAGYVTTVGLYNDFNDLVGVAKFNTPIRKDADHNVVTQIRLDFGGRYEPNDFFLNSTTTVPLIQYLYTLRSAGLDTYDVSNTAAMIFKNTEALGFGGSNCRNQFSQSDYMWAVDGNASLFKWSDTPLTAVNKSSGTITASQGLVVRRGNAGLNNVLFSYNSSNGTIEMFDITDPEHPSFKNSVPVIGFYGGHSLAYDAQNQRIVWTWFNSFNAACMQSHNVSATGIGSQALQVNFDPSQGYAAGECFIYNNNYYIQSRYAPGYSTVYRCSDGVVQVGGGTVSGGFNAFAPRLYNGHIILGQSTAGPAIEIIRLSDWSVTSIGTGGVDGILISGKKLFFTQMAVINAYDITDPLHPVFLSSAGPGGFPSSFNGLMGYPSDGWDGNNGLCVT